MLSRVDQVRRNLRVRPAADRAGLAAAVQLSGRRGLLHVQRHRRRRRRRR